MIFFFFNDFLCRCLCTYFFIRRRSRLSSIRGWPRRGFTNNVEGEEIVTCREGSRTSQTSQLLTPLVPELLSKMVCAAPLRTSGPPAFGPTGLVQTMLPKRAVISSCIVCDITQFWYNHMTEYLHCGSNSSKRSHDRGGWYGTIHTPNKLLHRRTDRFFSTTRTYLRTVNGRALN